MKKCENCGFLDGINQFWIRRTIPNDGNISFKAYCKYCLKALKEKSIRERDGVSLRDYENSETFEDFIEKYREWNEMRLAEKDKENLGLKLQLKEKENEILTLKLKILEFKLENNLNISTENS